MSSIHHPLNTAHVWTKIDLVRAHAQQLLMNQMPSYDPIPARDALVLKADELPPKKGLSQVQGQRRLLHDLASIELQAMELGVRTLQDFPDADPRFREELLAIVLSEANHLEHCLLSLNDLGGSWGEFPVHLALWHATDVSDSLLDRILIVHRYLEGSGLDAGDTLLRRLWGMKQGSQAVPNCLDQTVRLIVREEIGHVEFGSRWYREICRLQKIEAQDDFPERMEKIRYRVPKRIEPVSRKLRLAAGFTENEICYLEKMRQQMSRFQPRPSFADQEWNQKHLEGFIAP